MKTSERSEILAQELTRNLHLTDAENLIAVFVPDIGRDSIRRRADSAHGALGRAGRFRHAVWGVICILIALGFVAGAVLVPTASHGLASAAALFLVVGIMLVLMFDPKPALQHAEAFDRFCTDTDEQWLLEAKARATTLLEPVLLEMARFPRGAMRAGNGGKNVLEALQSSKATANATSHEIEARTTAALSKARELEEEYGKQIVRLRTSARSWTARLWASAVRRPANRVVDVREALLAANRQAQAAHLAGEIASQLNHALDEVIRNWDSSVVLPLNDAKDKASKLVDDYVKQGSRNLFGKSIPESQEITSLSERLINAKMSEICRSVAITSEHAPICNVMDNQVRTAIETSKVIPENLADCVGRMNGKLDDLLTQLTAEGSELVVSKPIPGRVPRRLRTVIVSGGDSSPLTRAIAERSEGCIVRGLEHESDLELIEFTEARFEPGAEIVELREASAALSHLSEDAKEVMITAVDEDDLILKHSQPERRSDPEAPYRLLVLGVITGQVIRSGSEQYRESDVTDPKNGHFGKGFEHAAHIIGTDVGLACRLESRIAQVFQSEGEAAVLQRIRESFSASDFVPSAAMPTFRRILLEEFKRRGGNPKHIQNGKLPANAEPSKAMP